jgi:ferredoxin
MPVVYFVKQDVTVECPVGTNLRQLALANEIDLYAFPNNIFNCRARALCGTCRVKVDEPRALSARTPGDERKTGWEGPHYRLACQSRVLADVKVTTNPRRVLGWMEHPTYEWLQKQPA